MQIWAAGKSVMQVTTKSSSSRDTPPFRFHRRGRPFSGLQTNGCLPLSHPGSISFPHEGQFKKHPSLTNRNPLSPPHPVSQTRAQQVLAAAPPTSLTIRENELRVALEGEEKARPAYGKSPKGFFHRLQGFFRAGAEGGI